MSTDYSWHSGLFLLYHRTWCQENTKTELDYVTADLPRTGEGRCEVCVCVSGSGHTALRLWIPCLAMSEQQDMTYRGSLSHFMKEHRAQMITLLWSMSPGSNRQNALNYCSAKQNRFSIVRGTVLHSTWTDWSSSGKVSTTSYSIMNQIMNTNLVQNGQNEKNESCFDAVNKCCA